MSLASQARELHSLTSSLVDLHSEPRTLHLLNVDVLKQTTIAIQKFIHVFEEEFLYKDLQVMKTILDFKINNC